MTKLKIYLLISGIIFTVISLQSCSSCSKQKESNGHSTYTTVQNSRYHFEFTIPNTWSAKDISDNGDGFIIFVPDSTIEIRVYGQMRMNKQTSLLFENCTVQEFQFNDGHKGELCAKDPTQITVSRTDSLIGVSAFIKATQSISEEYKNQFLEMAKSLKII